MKKISVILLALVLSTGLLGACSQESRTKVDKKKSDLLSTVKDAKVLTVGTEGTYPPFTFHDKSGTLTGFDVEIAQEVGKRLGVEVKFVETQWDSLLAGLEAKRYDMVANQVGIRDDRIAKYDFSNPYISSPSVLVALKSNSSIAKFEDIKGKKTAQSLTSNFADMARGYGAEIVGVEGLSQAIELLKAKRVEATINDRLSILDYLNTTKDDSIQIVQVSDEKASSGLLFRKNSGEIVKEVNIALDEMTQDGTYEKISQKWFGVDVSK